MISIRELAKECGVSIATVSRAMAGGVVKKETREKVLAIVKKHHYIPSSFVEENIKGKSGVVGYIAPFVAPTYQADFTRALQEKLYIDDLQLFIAPSWDEKTLHQSMERFASRRVKAIIVILPTHLSVLPKSVIQNVPTLSINLRSRQEGVYSLVANFKKAGADSAKYLLNKGHREILYLCESNDKELQWQRERGFMEVMKTEGINPLRCEVDFSDPEWGEKLQTVVSGNKQITAVMVGKSELVAPVIFAMERNGRNIPEDVSVLGGGGTLGMFPTPRRITFFEYPMDEVTDNLVNWIRDEKTKLSPCELTLREFGSVKDMNELCSTS